MLDTGEIREKTDCSDKGPSDCVGTAWSFRGQHSFCGLMAVLWLSAEILTNWCLRRKRGHFLLRKMRDIPNLICPFLIFFLFLCFSYSAFAFLPLFLPLLSSYPCFLFPRKSYCWTLKDSPLKKKKKILFFFFFCILWKSHIRPYRTVVI